MEVPDPGRDTGGVLQPERHVMAEWGFASEQFADVLSAHIKSAGKLSGIDALLFHPLLDEVPGRHDVVGACGVRGHACLPFRCFGGLVVVDDLDDAGDDRSAAFIGDDESPVGSDPGLVIVGAWTCVSLSYLDGYGGDGDAELCRDRSVEIGSLCGGAQRDQECVPDG